MAYDFKKEFRELYRPSGKPSVVTVPPMSYVAVRGKGDPNAEGGEYQNALPLLYGVAYTIKMSKKGPREIEGYFDFVVPRSRASGGKTAPMARLIMRGRMTSTSSRASVCPISSLARTSTGQFRKLPPRRSWTSRRSSC